MLALRRNRLARLGESGWTEVLARPWDEVARACLAHWAARGLPLVVTQQPRGLVDDAIALGLPAPLQWGRRRIALQVRASSLLALDDFPAAVEIAGQLPPQVQAAWAELCDRLESAGISAQAYGSHGWARLTGLPYLHPGSDVDLRLEVAAAADADTAAALLDSSRIAQPRIDGELAFADGSDIGWREWRQWRSGRVVQVLVKRLNGVALETCPVAAPAVALSAA